MTSSSNSRVGWPDELDPETLGKILDIVAKEGVVDRAEVRPDATLESLDIASIDVVSILMAVEEELGIYVPIDNEMAAAKNLSEFIAKIASPGSDDAVGGSPTSV